MATSAPLHETDHPPVVEAAPIIIEVIGQTTLLLGAAAIKLTEGQESIFNSLAAHREQPLAVKDFVEQGFPQGETYSATRQRIRKAMGELRDELQVDDKPLIEAIGNKGGAKYRFLETLQIIDRRDKGEASAKIYEFPIPDKSSEPTPAKQPRQPAAKSTTREVPVATTRSSAIHRPLREPVKKPVRVQPERERREEDRVCKSIPENSTVINAADFKTSDDEPLVRAWKRPELPQQLDCSTDSYNALEPVKHVAFPGKTVTAFLESMNGWQHNVSYFNDKQIHSILRDIPTAEAQKRLESLITATPRKSVEVNGKQLRIFIKNDVFGGDLQQIIVIERALNILARV